MKNKIILLIPTHNAPKELKVFLTHLQKTLSTRTDTKAYIFDNNSDKETKALLKATNHPHLHITYLPKNIGKGNACNNFIRENISKENLPKVLISLDADIIFSPESFDHFTKAASHIPNLGILGMRYTKNPCNPEKRLWQKKTIKGTDNNHYTIRLPFLCNVAGGILAIPGETLKTHLNYELYPKAEGKTYYPDDAFIHDKLKTKNLKIGYLDGTEATHLKTSIYTILDDPIHQNNLYKI